jgi:hypothetical protein
MTDTLDRSDSLGKILGHVLSVAALLGFGYWGVSTIAPNMIPNSQASQASAQIVVRDGFLEMGGKKYPAITSEFTPKGRFVIESPFVDETTKKLAYPFLKTDWEAMDDRNELKRTIAEREKRSRRKEGVAYSIHIGDAGQPSQGCVLLNPKDFNAVKDHLPGKTIEIQ